MPNRIIRESARTSPTLDQLSDGAERMFWRLTTVADDFGRFEADPRAILAACFPLRVGRMKLPVVVGWLGEAVTCGLVTTYAVNGRKYGFFNTWEKHQRTRAKESKYPAPSDDNICPRLADIGGSRARASESESESRESRIEESGEASNGASPPPSTPAVVFRMPESIGRALGKCPRLGADRRISDPAYWQAEVRANPGVDFAGEVVRAEAWLVAHPERHYKRLTAFLHNWLARADREGP